MPKHLRRLYQTTLAAQAKKWAEPSRQAVTLAIQAAPTGKNLTKEVKAQLLERVELQSALRALNAVELDHRVTQAIAPKSAGSGTAFGDVLTVTPSPGSKADCDSLVVTSGLPANFREYRAGWPAATHALNCKPGEKAGFYDIEIPVGGVAFKSSLRKLRMLELSGDGARDITLRHDPARRAVIGRTDRPGQVTVVEVK